MPKPKVVARVTKPSQLGKIDWIRDPIPPFIKPLDREFAIHVVKEIDRRIQYVKLVHEELLKQRKEVGGQFGIR